MTEQAKFDEWALVEIMGRQRIAGKVTEATLAGGAFLRVDVPDPETGATLYTRYYAPGSIYCISPISREAALALCKHIDAEPVKRWELPQQLADKVADSESDSNLYASEYEGDDLP